MKNFELENARLQVILAGDGSLLTVRDKATGQKFEAADYAVFWYANTYRYQLSGVAHAEVSGTATELKLVFTQVDYRVRFPESGFCKPDPGPDLRFVFRIQLADDEVVFLIDQVDNLDAETIQVEFPCRPLRWSPQAPGALAFSGNSYGSLWEFPSPRASFRSRHEPLPLAGYFNASGGIGVRIVTPFDQTTEYLANDNIGYMGSRFDFAKSTIEYRREMRMFFLPPGANYVQLAKFYRRKIQQQGHLVTLQQKIACNPEVGQLPGTVLWKHNVYFQRHLPPGVHKDYSLYATTLQAGEREGKVGNWSAYEVFDTAHRAGFDRVCILNTGWNHYGFDSGYPTRFPINPQRGTSAEFREAAEYGRRISPDYLLSVHDNYRDSYPNSPEFNPEEMIHNSDQIPVKGGVWRGGRCYLMCGECSLKYAKRDLKRIAELSGRGCIYLDVMGCVDFLSCCHPQHPGSGRDDAAHRLEIFREAKQQFGAVATEGAPHDFCAGVVDVGAYCSIRPALHSANCHPIPLWQLIYHDAMLNYSGEGISGVSGRSFRNYQALYGLLPAGFDAENLVISQKLRHTATMEMLEHEFLPDHRERTIFADGTEIIADFSEPEADDGNFSITQN